ncbi:MAG: hypothetical protein DRI69_03355 [Bacteroidetes bacterium]|nr:MAG: hypothetical protein DRI69_03355 [Bacteroidota bacterium]
MNRIEQYKIFFLGLFAMFIFLISGPVILNGQNDEPKSTQKKEQVQKKARIQLDYYNSNDQEYIIKATVKTKEGRSYVNVPGVPVQFAIAAEIEEYNVDLGEIVSDASGVAQFTGNVSDLPRFGIITIKTAIAESADFKKYSKKLEVQNASMVVDYVTEDSTNLIKVRCFTTDSTGEEVPIDDLDIKVFVERLFGELPVSDEFNETDDDGYVEIVFPDNVNGTIGGLLTVVVRVEDHDDYGNLVNQKETSWGIPLINNDNANARLLWAGKYKAPLALVILINGVLGVVWGMILYIVINIVRIFRIGKATKSTMQT